MTEALLIAIIGSGGFAAIVSAIIAAISKRSKLKKLEKDTVRLQLLFLMYVIPDEEQELMTLGQYYFETLHADWYLSSLFDKWLKKRGLERPSWFKGGTEQ
jgi:hypothetical protein